MLKKKVFKVFAIMAALAVGAVGISSIATVAVATTIGENSNEDNVDTTGSNVDLQITKPSSDLTTEWWQWIMSIPEEENPVTDKTGEDCSQGNFGDTFFLAGTD